MGVVGGPDPIVTDGLVFAIDPANSKSYPGSGTTVTNLLDTNTGTMSGVTFNSSNSGVFNFDGTDDIINFGTILRFNHTAESYTLSNWINVDTFSTNTKIFASNRLWNTLNYQGYSIGARQVSSDNIIEVAVWNGGNGAIYRGLDNPINPNTWYNIVYTFDYTESTVVDKFKIYLNGVSINLTQHSSYGTAPTNFTYSSNFGFGAAEIGGGNEGGYFDGQIGPSLVYNKKLEASKVLQNYNALKHRFV